MTATIYFFSKAGYMPMKDPSVRALISGSHGWRSDGDTWVFGVCNPRDGVSPLDVVDALTALGVHVLPSVHDKDSDVHPEVHEHLAKHGVISGDKAHHVAKKMHAASGFPPLRPHLFV